MADPTSIRPCDYRGRVFWKIFVGSLLAGGGLAAAFTFLVLKPAYGSTALVFIAQDRFALASDFTSVPPTETEKPDLRVRSRSLESIATSADLALDVIRRMGSDLPPAEQDPIRLLSRIHVSTAGEILRIQALTRDSQLSAKLANAWAEALCARSLALLRSDQSGITAIREEAKTAHERHLQAQKRMDEFTAAEDHTASLQIELKGKESALEESNTVLRKVRRALNDAESILATLKNERTSKTGGYDLRVALIMLRLNSLESGAGTSVDLQLALPDGAGIQASPVPSVEHVERLIEELRERTRRLETSVQDKALREDLLGIQGRIDRIREQRRLLHSQRELAWDVYVSLSRRATELGITANIPLDIPHAVGRAIPNPNPESPRPAVNIGIGCLVGALIGLLCARIVSLVGTAR